MLLWPNVLMAYRVKETVAHIHERDIEDVPILVVAYVVVAHVVMA